MNKKTKEFASFVSQEPVFVRFRKAAEKMENDKEALSLIEKVETAKSKEELKKLQKELSENETCVEFLRAQQEAVSAAQEICNTLTEETGIPFANGGKKLGVGCCG